MRKLQILSSVLCMILLTGCASWFIPEGDPPDDLTGPSGTSRMTSEAAESAMASALTRFMLMRGLTPAEISIQPEQDAEQRFISSLDRNLFSRANDPDAARFLLESRYGKHDWELLLKERKSGEILWRKKLEW